MISRRGQAGEGLVDQHHLGIARHRFGELHAAQIGERQRPWMPLQNAAQSDRSAMARARSAAEALRRKPQQRVGQQRQLDVLQHSLPLQRPRMLEDDARRPARAMRCAGQPAMSTPSSRIAPGIGARRCPMISDMTVDLPEPFGPISPTISPARRSKLMFLTATTPPKRLRELVDLQTDRAGHSRLAPRATRSRAGHRGRTG